MPAIGTTFGTCTLGTYTYPYNPGENSVNPPQRSVSRAPTWNGAVVTDWGLVPQDQVILQEWPYMEASVFSALQTMYQSGGTYAFTDEWGNSYTVVIGALTYKGITPGGVLFTQVSMSLWTQ